VRKFGFTDIKYLYNRGHWKVSLLEVIVLMDPMLNDYCQSIPKVLRRI
jgi:hypothetical protein